MARCCESAVALAVSCAGRCFSAHLHVSGSYNLPDCSLLLCFRSDGMTVLCGTEHLPSLVSMFTSILYEEVPLIRRERNVTLVYCKR